MYRNNFNANSEGLNIEVTAFYDTMLSDILFKEQFHTLWYGYAKRNCFCYDSSFDKEATVEDLVDFRRMTKKEMIEVINELEDWYVDEEYKVDELRHQLKGLKGSNVPWLYEHGYVKPKKGFTFYTSKGYCQGDSTLCLIPDNMQYKYVDHLLWDAPVYASVMINDTEYLHSEYCSDEYEWNKQDFINSILEDIKDNKDKIKQELEHLLPDELNYT